MINIADQYYVKAYENYNWCAEFAMESLSYALSYDETHAPSLVLMARLQIDYLGNVEASYEYFEKAIASDLGYLPVYYFYCEALIKGNYYKKAMKLLEFANKRRGIDKSEIYKLYSLIHEKLKNHKMALKYINLGIENNYFSDNQEKLKEIRKRVKKKLKNGNTKLG